MTGTTESMVLEMNSGNETDMVEPYRQPTFAAVIFITIGVVGTIGNALVCIVITSTLAWSKSGTTNLLILNQAVIDSMTSFILILSYALPDPAVPKEGGWSEFICRMWVPHTLLWMLFVVSTYNLCMMSLERYFAVAYPVIYSTRFKKQNVPLDDPLLLGHSPSPALLLPYRLRLQWRWGVPETRWPTCGGDHWCLDFHLGVFHPLHHHGSGVHSHCLSASEATL